MENLSPVFEVPADVVFEEKESVETQTEETTPEVGGCPPHSSPLSESLVNSAKGHIRSLRKEHYRFCAKIFNALSNSGALIFGGAVRDHLLHQQHSKMFYKSCDVDSSRRKLYDDPSFDLSTCGRLLTPNDFDILCTKKHLAKFLQEMAMLSYRTTECYLCDEVVKNKVGYFRMKEETKKNLTFKQFRVTSPLRTNNSSIEQLLSIFCPEISHIFTSMKIDVLLIKETPHPKDAKVNDLPTPSKIAKDIFKKMLTRFPEPEFADFECNTLTYNKETGFRTTLGVPNLHYSVYSRPLTRDVQTIENVQYFLKIVSDISNMKAVVHNVESATPFRISKMISKKSIPWKISICKEGFKNAVKIYKVKDVCISDLFSPPPPPSTPLNGGKFKKPIAFFGNLSEGEFLLGNEETKIRFRHDESLNEGSAISTAVAVENVFRAMDLSLTSSASRVSMLDVSASTAIPTAEALNEKTFSDFGVCIICQEGFTGDFRSECRDESICKNKIFKLRCCNAHYHASCFLKSYGSPECRAQGGYDQRSCFTCKNRIDSENLIDIERMAKFYINISKSCDSVFGSETIDFENLWVNGSCKCIVEKTVSQEENFLRQQQSYEEDYRVARALALQDYDYLEEEEENESEIMGVNEEEVVNGGGASGEEVINVD